MVDPGQGLQGDRWKENPHVWRDHLALPGRRLHVWCLYVEGNHDNVRGTLRRDHDHDCVSAFPGLHSAIPVTLSTVTADRMNMHNGVPVTIDAKYVHTNLIAQNWRSLGRRVTWCYVTDPEGNVIELQSWSEEGR